MAQVFARFGGDRPLYGIVHAAGVLDDGLLLQQTWSRFKDVLAPKVQGSWNLHTLSREMPLDFFVLFSSLAALLGSAAQANHAAANAFLDALAHYRRSRGLPALSINWGAWSEVGAAARGDVAVRVRQKGMGTIDPAQGLQVLEQLMREHSVQAGVFPVVWPVFRRQALGEAVPPFLEDVLAKESRPPDRIAPAAPGIRQRLAAAASPQRHAELVTYLRQQVADVLRLPVERVDVSQPLNEAGLDSLMAVELRNRFRTSLSVDLPMVKFMEDLDIRTLADHVGRQLPEGETAHEPEAGDVETGRPQETAAGSTGSSGEPQPARCGTASCRTRSVERLGSRCAARVRRWRVIHDEATHGTSNRDGTSASSAGRRGAEQSGATGQAPAGESEPGDIGVFAVVGPTGHVVLAPQRAAEPRVQHRPCRSHSLRSEGRRAPTGVRNARRPPYLFADYLSPPRPQPRSTRTRLSRPLLPADRCVRLDRAAAARERPGGLRPAIRFGVRPADARQPVSPRAARPGLVADRAPYHLRCLVHLDADARIERSVSGIPVRAACGTPARQEAVSRVHGVAERNARGLGRRATLAILEPPTPRGSAGAGTTHRPALPSAQRSPRRVPFLYHRRTVERPPGRGGQTTGGDLVHDSAGDVPNVAAPLFRAGRYHRRLARRGPEPGRLLGDGRLLDQPSSLYVPTFRAIRRFGIFSVRSGTLYSTASPTRTCHSHGWWSACSPRGLRAALPSFRPCSCSNGRPSRKSFALCSQGSVKARSAGEAWRWSPSSWPRWRASST